MWHSLSEALDLLIPSSCLCCRGPSGPLCSGCAAAFARERAPSERMLAGIRVVSAARYDDTVRALLLALKRRHRRGAAALLVDALRILLAGDSRPVILIAPPSAYSRRVARGFDPVSVIAHRAGTRADPVLRRVRRASDQIGLGRAGRERNLVGAFRARRTLAGVRVALIDDVLTTGSTLDELARAVRAAGGEVIGAATVAYTPRRGAPRRSDQDARHPRKVLGGNVRRRDGDEGSTLG
ncbi:ComF family protein [Microbacteriaceae bacterium VKM Ac-2854]|nr:ComF family protein [Microbacteriaceae bacterium VKM Ac-2854]